MIFSIMIGFIEDTKKSYSHKLTFFVTITSKLILSQRHLVSHVFSSHTSDDDLMTESEPDNSPPLRLWPRSRSQWQPVTPALYRWLGWSPAQAAWLWLNTDYLIPACPALGPRTLTGQPSSGLMVRSIPWGRRALLGGESFMNTKQRMRWNNHVQFSSRVSFVLIKYIIQL